MRQKIQADDEPNGWRVTRHKARKEHECECGHSILPGEMYQSLMVIFSHGVRFIKSHDGPDGCFRAEKRAEGLSEEQIDRAWRGHCEEMGFSGTGLDDW